MRNNMRQLKINSKVRVYYFNAQSQLMQSTTPFTYARLYMYIYVIGGQYKPYSYNIPLFNYKSI